MGAGRRHTGRVTRHTPALADAICRRLEAGEGLNGICRDASLPCRDTILNWRKTVPGFRERYDQARARQAEARLARGLAPSLGGGRWRYTDAVARTICDRLAAGESLLSISRDPAMPGCSTIMRWVDQKPDFCQAYRRARQHQANTLIDEVLDTARGDLPPADKQARMKGLSWAAGKLSPVKYGDEADAPESGEGALFQVVIVKNGGMEGTE